MGLAVLLFFFAAARIFGQGLPLSHPQCLGLHAPMSSMSGADRPNAPALLEYRLDVERFGASTRGPVGMEAAGVDPETALRYAGTLDVRDALGRSVSAGLIERQLKSGMNSAAEQTAFASGLPRFRTVLRILEILIFHAATLAGGPVRRPPRAEQALPWILRPLCRFAFIAASVVAIRPPCGLLHSAQSRIPDNFGSRRCDVLRC